MKIRKRFKNIVEKFSRSLWLRFIERILILTALATFMFELSDRSSDRVTRAYELISSKLSGPSQKKGALEFLNSHSCWRIWDRRPGCSWTTFKKRQGFLYLDLGPAKRPNSFGIGNGTYGVHLHGAELVGASFTEAYIENGYFMGADLRHSSFALANLENVHFQSANLKNASFGGANLMLARLDNAKLENSTFKRACLIGASLNNVSFENVNLDEAVVSYSLFDTALLSTKQKSTIKGLELVFTDSVKYNQFRFNNRKEIEKEKRKCWNSAIVQKTYSD